MRDYDGKTAAERIAERRERLIDAGVELFGYRGYAATSIRSVLQQSGLRDRYFGESFADLDSLLAAVYSRLIDEEISGCAAAIDKTNGGSEGARAMIDTITRSFEKNPGKARIKSREILSGGPVAREQRQAGLRRLAQLVADLNFTSLYDRALLAAYRRQQELAWIEQLVAESTGKNGQSIVPVDLEALAPPIAMAPIASSCICGS